MGFFSWKTQDTWESISNKFSNRPTFTVYMHDNQNNFWAEDDYEGSGMFGGKDYYELLAEMNGLKTRNEGINLVSISISKKEYLSPNLVTVKIWSYLEYEHPEICLDQGYFYYEEGDEDEESSSE